MRGRAVRITDKDRELAAELVDLLTDGAADALTVKCVAIALAAHRFAEQGRCGHRAPVYPDASRLTDNALSFTPICALPAGHDGWHRGDRDAHGNAPEWSQ